MPYQDFRQFLDVLRKHGELVDIDRPIDLQTDVGKALKQSYVRNGPALLFSQNGTEFPLVGGLYSTRSKALLAKFTPSIPGAGRVHPRDKMRWFRSRLGRLSCVVFIEEADECFD